MKTINDFKNEVAQSNSLGYKNWEDMVEQLGFNEISSTLLFERLQYAAEKYAEYIAIEFLKHREGHSTATANMLFIRFKENTK